MLDTNTFNKNYKMTASQALKLSKESQEKNREQVFAQIKSSALQGRTDTLIFCGINTQFANELQEMGYMIGKVSDQIGTKNIKISWS